MPTMIIGALIFTYFFSRLILRFPYRLRGTGGLMAVHALSLGLVAAMLLLLRIPPDTFAPSQMLIYIAGQLVWLFVDLIRNNLPNSA